jgi:hypothetical protein
MKKILLYILLLLFFPPPVSGEEEAPLPYSNEITGIINSIEYSGFAVLTKPEITLSIDFNKQSWTLHNIHQYDTQGGIILEQGRYGLCAELSTYLYQKLQPMIDSRRFGIKLAMATESGFFPTAQSNHIVLLMYDKITKNTYLIDPSYHKYGNIKDLNEYQILALQDALTFMKDRSPDVSFLVNQAMPLFIKDDLLLSLSATTVDAKFDKDNFLLVVTANKRNKIAGLNIVVVGKYNGKVESFESSDFLAQVLEPQEIDRLHNKLDTWIQQLNSNP